MSTPAPQPPPPASRHRLVAQMCQAASEATFVMTPHNLGDLTHCIAALGVDVHRLAAEGGGEARLSPVLRRLVERLDRLHRQLIRCFQGDGGAVRPDTACVLLLHLISRIAGTEGVDQKVLADLAAAKLQPGGGQDGHEVVSLARQLRERSVQRLRQDDGFGGGAGADDDETGS